MALCYKYIVFNKDASKTILIHPLLLIVNAFVIDYQNRSEPLTCHLYKWRVSTNSVYTSDFVNSLINFCLRVKGVKGTVTTQMLGFVPALLFVRRRSRLLDRAVYILFFQGDRFSPVNVHNEGRETENGRVRETVNCARGFCR